MVRVGNELLGHGVAAAQVLGHYAHRQRLTVDVVEVVLQVALLLVEEGLFVGEEQLHVAGLGTVDGGVVDLVEGAVRGGEPYLAGGGVRGGDRVLAAGCPAGLQSGRAKGRAVVVQPAIRTDKRIHAAYSTTKSPFCRRFRCPGGELFSGPDGREVVCCQRGGANLYGVAPRLAPSAGCGASNRL